MIALTIDGDAAAEFSLVTQSTTCVGAVLAPAASCDITLSFTPAAAGPRAASLGITSNPGGSTRVALVGEGLVGQLHLDPTTLDFAVVKLGSTATATIAVVNDSMVDAPLGAIAVTGGGFAMTGSTCSTTLPAGDTCSIDVTFTPSTVGAANGMLVVTADGIDHTAMLLGAGGVATLRLTPATIDFQRVEIGTIATTVVTLVNDGTATAELASITVTGTTFTKQSSTCGSTLAGSSSCEITVAFAPTAQGARSGTLVVTAEGTTLSKGLSGLGGRRVTVVRAGTGMGTVTAFPTVIDCGATCSGLFEGNAALTATPATGSVFSGWSEAGCTTTTCNVPPGTDPRTVTAIFTLSQGPAVVTVAFAGTARGEVGVDAGGTVTVCTSACNVPYSPGETVTVFAATPSTLTGISGACATSTNFPDTCNFTAPTGTSVVTATFSKAPKERWTFLGDLDERFIATDLDSAGNVIAGSSNRVIKLDLAGGLVWSKPLAVLELSVGVADVVYVAGATSVTKLDASGGTVWTKPYGAVTAISASPNGNIVIAADGNLTVYDSGGVQQWTVARSVDDFVIDAASGIHIPVPRNSADQSWFDTARYTATGTPLANVVEVSPIISSGANGDVLGQLALDATGRYVGLMSNREAYVQVSPVGGAIAYQLGTMSASSRRLASLVSPWSTDVAWIRAQEEFNDHGFTLKKLSPTGSTSYTLFRQAIGCGANGDQFFAMAGGPTGQLSIVGRYQGLLGGYCGTTKSVGWIQTFDP